MQLAKYYSASDQQIQFSRQQASAFAKEVAGDFNPIHDPDAKRFCVPGDLLFALVLARYGLSQHMHCQFSGMVGEGVKLNFQDSDAEHLDISDSNGKTYLSIQRQGAISRDPELINSLTRHYVAFSGRTFPHILVPLMAKHAVMINPDRPLVIYESMTIALDSVDIGSPELELTDAQLKVEGKRGDVRLVFCLKDAGKLVGKGEKTMLLSGLRPYDEGLIDRLVADYGERKRAYHSDTAA